MIRTNGLTKNFNGTLAVDRLTLEIYEGEVFGVLGPNGEGKTTTVRMLTSLISPSSGSAVVNGSKSGKKITRYGEPSAYSQKRQVCMTISLLSTI
jgi:ABC-type multidrug transport system ATPase subunit